MIQVPIPSGYNVGSIIGKGGSNCKELQSRYGTRVSVDTNRMVVVCAGGRCTEAAEAIRRQIAAGQSATLGAYPHPLEIVYVLPTNNPYRFKAFHGPAIPQRGAGGRILQLHVLEPLAAAVPRVVDRDGVGGLTAMLGAASITKVPNSMQVLLRPAMEAYCDQLNEAARKAAAHRPAFDEIKMRYSLGKQTFYESRAPSSAATLCRQFDSPRALSSCVIAHDGHFKSMFSEYLTDTASDAIEARAARLGFKRESQKLHISLHLKDYGHKSGAVAGVVVSLRVDDPRSREVVVRKIKSSTAKPILIAFLSSSASGSDFRLKMVAQNHFKESSGATGTSSGDVAEAWRYARGCVWSPSKQEVVPPASDRFVMDTVRTKAKRVHSGTFQGHSLRLTSTLTQDEAGSHVQMGGCSPAVQAALAAGRALPSDALHAMVAFCDSLVS